MNILSLLSAMLATAFLIGALYCLTRNRKSELNVFSFLVLLSLGWWSFCNAFFFSSADAAQAWHWHHLASIGWTGFIAETAYYFIVLTGFNEKMKHPLIKLLYYAFPFAMLLCNLTGKTTSLATSLTKSTLGNQWAYVNSLSNPHLWGYLALLFLYFGFAFVLLFDWARKVRHRLKKTMAIGFVALDALTIVTGFITDVVFPLTNQYLPSVANLCTAIFGAGYFFIIIRYDLFNVRNVVDDRVIIDRSMEALMVVDEVGEILDANKACGELLNSESEKLIGTSIKKYFDRVSFNFFSTVLKENGSVNGVEVPVTTSRGEMRQILVSGSVIRDRKKEYIGTVISIRDITQLNELKEQYRLKSEQYRHLAFVDTLTGLPNRRKTFEQISDFASGYAENGSDFYILYMDIDRFKSVNDLYGHSTGDDFLRMVSDRFSGCVRRSLKFLGRLGGDEFLIIGEYVSDEDTELNIRTIVHIFKNEFILGNIRINSGVSVGCAKYSDYKNIDDMVHHADEEMYRNKQEKKSRITPAKEKYGQQ